MSSTVETDLGSLAVGPELCRLMADHAPAMMWVTDASGHVVALNRAWYEFSGRTPTQDEGDGWIGLVHPDDREDVERQWQEAVIKGTSYQGEYRLRRADGQYRWVLDEGRPVLDEQGRLRGFVGSCRDVTERRAAADELRASAAVLRDVARALPGVLYQYEIREDGARRYTYVSDGVRELLGLEPGALMGDAMILYNLVRPSQRQGMLDEGAAALREGRPSRHEVEMRLPDASYRPVRVRASCTQRPDGTRVWTGLILDVTEERRVLAALTKSQEREQLALETAADGLWDWNIQTGDLYVAPRNLEMLGYDPSTQPITRIEQWQALWHPEDRPEVQRRMREHIEAQATPLYEHERRLRHRDGHYVWTQVRGRVVQRGPSGEALRMVGTNVDLTERRARERALRQSEERFRTAFEHAPVGMVLQNAEGEVLQANPAMCEMTGYSEPELLAMGIAGLTHPEDREINTAPRAALLSGEEASVQYEKRYIHKSGRVIGVLVCVAALKEEGGPVTGFVGQVLDITAQRDAARGLRESEERFRAAFEHAATGMSLVDAEGRFVRVNAVKCRMFGYEPQDLLGRNVSEVSLPEDMPLNLKLRADLDAGVIPALHMEKRYVRKDGRMMWAHLSAAPLRDSAGVVTGYISQTLDISAQKAAEAALRESMERFRVLAEMAPVGIFMTDASGDATYLNPRWLEMSGLTHERAVGRGWIDAVHPDDRERVLREWYEGASRSELHTGECRYLTSSGVVRWVYTTARPLRGERGEITGFLGTVTDVTELKEAEARLRHGLTQREDLLRREAALRRELDHRVRNNLAALLGLVAVYERSNRGDAGMSDALRGKILAMREVHEVITRSPGSPVGLAQLIARLAVQLLAPQQAAAVAALGPELPVPTAQAGAIAMILQEFFTNARKHGSMSVPGGGIRVSWEASPGQEYTDLRLTWSEFGGPPAMAPPAFGVGLRLVEGFAASELRGGVEARFSRDGFSCILRARLAGPHTFAGGPGPRAEPLNEVHHEQPSM